MKTYQRAIRRHHRARLLNKRKNYWGRAWSIEDEPISKKVINTPKPCSCFMCGNPRRYWKEKTFQEQKFRICMEYQINSSI
ncbi:MAG: hypothetical protein R3E32_16960 [Chitinophagales bacterium]